MSKRHNTNLIGMSDSWISFHVVKAYDLYRANETLRYGSILHGNETKQSDRSVMLSCQVPSVDCRHFPPDITSYQSWRHDFIKTHKAKLIAPSETKLISCMLTGWDTAILRWHKNLLFVNDVINYFRMRYLLIYFIPAFCYYDT